MASPAALLPCFSSYLNMHLQVTSKKTLGLASSTRRTNSLPTITRSSLTDNARLLEEAAKHTVDTYIRSGMVVGLGSGLASGMAVQYLGRQLRGGAIQDIIGIPTSVGSASVAAKAGIPLDNYQDCPKINFSFSDADIIEEGTLAAVIGRRRTQGEESIIQEKTILEAAEKLVFIVTEKQYKGGLDGSVPVFVNSMIFQYNWMEAAEEIDDLFLGDAEVWRRSSIGHAGPLGGDFPLVTKEGHSVLDVIFTSPILNLADVAESLDKVDGVVGHGVISRIPCMAVIASENGLLVVDNLPKDALRKL